LVQNNTFANAYVVIDSSSPNATIAFNNILGGSEAKIVFSSTFHLDAANNWWGSTDVKAINESIHDSSGNVGFVPFLTAPNPEAMPESDPSIIPTPLTTQTPVQTPINTVSPSPSATQQPTASNSPTTEPTTTPKMETHINYIYGLTAAVIALIIVIIGLLVYLKKLRKQKVIS
jgi:hypothetical protein